MSIIMGRGEEAKKELESKGGGMDLKKAFIKLKAGQSRKVRILSPEDYITYKAHGHFANGIQTTPCIAPLGERCLLCEASNYDGEHVGGLIDEVENFNKEMVSEWKSMYAKKRVLFAFVDLEEGEEDEDGNPKGMLRVFDATKNQSDAIISTIEEYADDLDDMAFTFKRTGDGRETSYALNPIMPKKMKEVQSTYDLWEGEKVDDQLFEDALVTRSTEDQAKDLLKAGFPVKEVFDIEVKKDEDDAEEASETKQTKQKATKKDDDSEDVSDDDLPF